MTTLRLRALLDVNVLIALHDAQHVHHGAAARWFLAQAKGGWAGWASCPLTQNGAARIMSQPNYPNAAPVRDLLTMFAATFEQLHHAFWPDDISLMDAERFNFAHIHGPRQLTDLYLLALAVHQGGCLVSFDRSIPVGAVKGAKAGHLVVLGD